jgi:hypothetical protein
MPSRLADARMMFRSNPLLNRYSNKSRARNDSVIRVASPADRPGSQLSRSNAESRALATSLYNRAIHG